MIRRGVSKLTPPSLERLSRRPPASTGSPGHVKALVAADAGGDPRMVGELPSHRRDRGAERAAAIVGSPNVHTAIGRADALLRLNGRHRGDEPPPLHVESGGGVVAVVAPGRQREGPVLRPAWPPSREAKVPTSGVEAEPEPRNTMAAAIKLRVSVGLTAIEHST
jgi:hypothetical protein